jgi:hypothetical protein
MNPSHLSFGLTIESNWVQWTSFWGCKKIRRSAQSYSRLKKTVNLPEPFNEPCSFLESAGAGRAPASVAAALSF